MELRKKFSLPTTPSSKGRDATTKPLLKLDQGLVYQDQKEVYGEVMKWQTPIKRRLRRSCAGAIPRIRKLLEVTRLSPADQTEARLLLDKADDIAAMIQKRRILGRSCTELPA